MSPRSHLLLHAGLLAVPLAAAIALGAFFLVHDVPRLEDSMKRALTLQYREALDDLKADTNRWKDVSTLFAAGGGISTNDFIRAQPRAKEVWGYFRNPRTDGETILWRRDGRRRVYVSVPENPTFDSWLVFGIGFAAFGLILCVLTYIGIRYFVTYVKSRDDFLAATAHDLTTPLVGMRYAIGHSDADAARLNERMLRLVENIREFLRLGGRRRSPQTQTFDLRKAYDEAYALFGEDYRDLFDGRDVPVTGEGDFQVSADETMTVQILWNLLGNDLKYAAPHGPVRARFERHSDTVTFALEDEGPGMTPHERRKAFDRYYRAKTVLQSGKGGFGIGLCTAMEFVRAMGGTLKVGDNHPHGCVFTLTLPRAAVR